MTERILFKVNKLPVHQNVVYLTKEEAKACPRGDMLLVQNDETGLIYNAAFNPDIMTYNENYQNEQACSPAFQKHLKQVISIIHQHFHSKFIVEVGCGKGWFLDMLREQGFKRRDFLSSPCTE